MIGIASDHNGIDSKIELIKFLEEMDYDVINYGSNTEEAVDYPEYAFKIGEAINKKEISLGILICKTGIGMSIACNKVKGVRCAKIDNVNEAMLSRVHNNCNVLAIGSIKSIDELKEIVKTFVKTEFSNEERHVRRVNLITEYEV